MDSNFGFPNLAFRKTVCFTAALVLLFPVWSFAQTAQEEYAQAMSIYARGEYAASVPAFDRVIRSYPNTTQSSEAKFYLGEALVQQGDYGLAFAGFQGFLTEQPEHKFTPRATFRLGECAYQLGRNDQAIRLLEEFALRYPNNPVNEIGLTYLGELRLKNNEPQLAQRVFDSALKAYPNGQMADKCRMGLAKSLERQGHTREALAIFAYLLNSTDKSIVGQAHLQSGLMAFKAKDYASARAQLNQSRSVISGTTGNTFEEACYWAGRCWMAEESYQEALEEFQRVSETDVASELQLAAYRDAAFCAIQIGQSELANRCLSRLRTQFPEHPVAAQSLRLQIDLNYREQRFRESLALSNEFFANYPSHELLPKIKETVGRIHYHQGEFANAVASFLDLIREHSGDSATQLENVANWKYLLALAQIGEGSLSSAIRTLDSIRFNEETGGLAAIVEISRASTLSALKDYDAAITAYRNYLSLEPGGAEASRARTELCVALGQTKQWDEARIVFADLVSVDNAPPKVIETAQFLAKMAFADKKQDHAKYWYQFLVESGHSNDVLAEGLSGLAWTSMSSNDYESALRTFERLLNEFPDSDLASEAAMARAKFLDESNNFSEAEKMYRLVIEKFPQSRLAQIAMLRRAFALQKLNGKTNLKTAQELLTDYIQLPGEPDALDEAIYQLAWVYHDLGLQERSQEKFKKIIADFPESKFWADAAYRMAQSYVKQREFSTAQPLIARLLETDSQIEVLSRVVYLQGQIAGANGDWQQVAESMSQLVLRTNDPGLEAKASYWLAEALFKTDRFDEAKEVLDALLTHPESIDIELQPWIALRQAQCLVQLGQWSEALAAAELGSKVYSGFKAAFEFEFIRGRGFARDGKFDEARTAFQSVVNSELGGMTETAAIAQWRIGETYFHQEMFVEAIGAYEKVATQFPYAKWRAGALIQAGKCQEHLGNWKQAATLYKKLVNDHPESEFRPDAEKRLVRALRSARLDTESNTKR